MDDIKGALGLTALLIIPSNLICSSLGEHWGTYTTICVGFSIFLPCYLFVKQEKNKIK